MAQKSRYCKCSTLKHRISTCVILRDTHQYSQSTMVNKSHVHVYGKYTDFYSVCRPAVGLSKVHVIHCAHNCSSIITWAIQAFHVFYDPCVKSRGIFHKDFKPVSVKNERAVCKSLRNFHDRF